MRRHKYDPLVGIISLEKLLFLKALGMKKDKYRVDLELIVKKILDDKYAAWWATLSEERKQKYLAENK
jgi:hypothetical protein